MKQRALGLLIAFCGTLVVTPDAALLRVQTYAGGSTPVITVWRYLMSMVLGAIAAVVTHGGVAPVIDGIRPAPMHVVAASIIMLFTNVGFTISLLKVDPAKALLLISLNPLWSALMGRVLLGDKLPMRTIVAQALSLVAMGIMLVPNLMALLSPAEHDEGEQAEQDEMLDLVPLLTGISQAGLLIFVRYASKRHPEATMDFVPPLSALLTAAFAIGMAWTGERDWRPSSLVAGLQPQFWLALLGCGLGVAGYNLACTIAPRYLTGAEVSLVLLFESVGGPLWVFLGFGDVPSPWTLASGALLISSLVGHEVAAMYAQDDDDDEPASLHGSRVSSLPSSPLFPGKTTPLARPADAVTLGVSLLEAKERLGSDPVLEGRAQRSGYVPPQSNGVERSFTT